MGINKILLVVLALMTLGTLEAGAIDQSICLSGSNMVLYPSGALRSCVLKDPFHAKDAKCIGQSQASFYDNGQVETCVLAESATISGQQCSEFGPISFYPDGKFRSCQKKD